MQNIYYSVIKACDDSARKYIPSNREHTREKRLAGWYDHDEEHHQLALHPHYCWKIEGCPLNGHTADISRKIRAISNNSSRDLFSETHKIRSARGRGPMCVDNEIEDTVVADILNTKYNNLYNSVRYDKAEMNNIKDKIQRCIQQDKDNVYDINVDDVKKAVKHLKLGNGDDEESLFVTILYMLLISYMFLFVCYLKPC